MDKTRTEKDSLGSVEIPFDAYWGVHTLRAIENFPITRRQISVYPNLVIAYAMVKQAAARANKEIGVLEAEYVDLIDQACQRVIDGEYHDQFVVGVIQGGAGTSTNMNVNEVIANIALEIAGKEKGDYAYLSPIDQVNRSQSTNDTYPTAIKIALMMTLNELLVEHKLLTESFAKKGREFAGVIKIGRTQMQDAVPMTLGQEFSGFATTLGEDYLRLTEMIPHLSEVNLGATAIGTGITADPRYAETVIKHLREITGFKMVTAVDLIEATSDVGAFMSYSGVMKRAAVKLSKICNDLRLLSSGPQAGLGEINLPAKQAGSSIMPGKVNPVIPEVVNQVAFSIIGTDATVTAAVEAGQLQLNAFEPVIAHSLLQSTVWLRQACHTLRLNCVDGITANESKLHQDVASSVGVVTALTPYIGYAAAAELAHAALLGHSSVADLVVAAGLLSRERVEQLLTPERLSGITPVTAAIPIIISDGEHI
ncbi:MAG: aspartate ammonia-lyase [Microbacteriaceae bacterium]